MTRPLNPIHRPLEEANPKPAPPSSRFALLASLDSRVLSGRTHSLGAGGASALFSRAVDKALVDEMAEQLREGPFEVSEEDGDVRRWAKDIIEAFLEE